MNALARLIAVFSLSLAFAAPAFAVCGDVTGDGKKTANDALAVLRAAVGQPVNLQCNAGPSRLRYYNDFSCSSGSSVSLLEFNGYSFQADAFSVSPYQTVDLEQISDIHIELCNSDYYFDGPLNIPPDRQLEAFMIFADPEIYDFEGVDTPAFLVLFDVGENTASMSAGISSEPREIGAIPGGSRKR
jgi:hypothetical protein